MNDQNHDNLKLQALLSFPLYAAAKETVKLYRPLLEELNLTYTQYIAMMVIWQRRRLNVKELGAELYLDSGTLTPVLKSLEAKGYIFRNRSSEDERVLIVELTETGEALREKALPISEQMLRHIVLDREEAQTLYKLLYKMLGGFGKAEKD